MHPFHRWKAEYDAALRSLADPTGRLTVPTHDLAERFDVSFDAIHYHIRRLQLRSLQARGFWTASKLQQLRSLCTDDLTLTTTLTVAAGFLGCSPALVRRKLFELRRRLVHS